MQSESTLIYKGQEILAIYTPRLFDKAPINWDKSKNISIT